MTATAQARSHRMHQVCHAVPRNVHSTESARPGIDQLTECVVSCAAAFHSGSTLYERRDPEERYTARTQWLAWSGCGAGCITRPAPAVSLVGCKVQLGPFRGQPATLGQAHWMAGTNPEEGRSLYSEPADRACSTSASTVAGTAWTGVSRTAADTAMTRPAPSEAA